MTDLRRRFAELGTPERAAGEKKYLKSDLDFYGVTVPAIRRTAKELRAQYPDLSHTELLALVEALWGTTYHELRMVGIALLALFTDRLVAKDMAFLETMLRDSNTWAEVDWIAATVVGSVVQRFAGARKVLRRWSKDDNFWIRRAAMLALLGELRAGEGDFDLFASFAASMIEEKEFFIRKAIGWILRESGRKRPELTFAFLQTHIATVSGLTLREGSKHLPVAQKSALMRAYKNRPKR